MAETKPTPSSSLLNYLPGIYREDPFLGKFLLAFEQVLLKSPATNPDSSEKASFRGLEEIIATLSDLFVPEKTPPDFLPWLASWVAFCVWSDMSEENQRKFIANMMELYRWRGTEKNLLQLFEIYTGRKPTLPDVADAEPHYFKVLLDLSELVRGSTQSEEERQQLMARQIEIAHALIRLEKPAHTRYTLDLIFPSFQIGRQQGTKRTKYYTQVGKNTRLGVAKWSN